MIIEQPADVPASRLWSRVPRRMRELAPVLAVLPGAFVPREDLLSDNGGPQWPTLPTMALALAAAVLIGLRLGYPRTVAAVTIAATATVVLLGGPALSYLAALLIVIFSVARQTDRHTTVLIAVAATVAVGLAALPTLPEDWNYPRAFVQVAALTGFAAAAGDATRLRQAFIDSITERARRAEETKESEARRRVAEERLAIARDLHDVVAHQIAVINLHANVASSALPARPETVERSLATIRDAARTVLGEIAGLLHVLRTADSSSTGEPHALAPAAGLAQLDRLLADVERGGLRVEVRTVGEPVALPPAVDVVAYRVIAEGLTNAQKHGADASALLQVEYRAAEFEATVTNTVAPRTGRGSAYAGGHGLTGARERAAAVRGTLETGFGPGPVHRLVVRLPLSPPGAHPDSAATPAEAQR